MMCRSGSNCSSCDLHGGSPHGVVKVGGLEHGVDLDNEIEWDLPESEEGKDRAKVPDIVVNESSQPPCDDVAKPVARLCHVKTLVINYNF